MQGLRLSNPNQHVVPYVCNKSINLRVRHLRKVFIDMGRKPSQKRISFLRGLSVNIGIRAEGVTIVFPILIIYIGCVFVVMLLVVSCDLRIAGRENAYVTAGASEGVDEGSGKSVGISEGFGDWGAPSIKMLRSIEVSTSNPRDVEM